MRALIFGGSFNPVHNGHLFVSEDIRTALSYDVTILVPSNIPVHKPAHDLVSPIHRLNMLNAALGRNADVIVEDCEIRRGGRSYTIDTVLYLMEKYSLSQKPGLLIGDDLVNGFTSWKEADRLASMVDIVIAGRNPQLRGNFPYPHTDFPNILLPVSSSSIRTRRLEGKTIRYLVPECVFEYIVVNDLYRTDSAAN